MNNLTSYVVQTCQTLEQLPLWELQRVADAIWEAYQRDATIFVCGNGGSAATASHFACDLSKWTINPQARRVRAIALTDNVPLITAWSNDQEYADVFVEQLQALYRDGDIIIAISGSGNSANVVRAIEWGNRVGAVTIGITGRDGGRLYRIAKIGLHVKNNFMPLIEDIHSIVCHALAVNLGRQIEASLQPVILQAKAVGGQQ
ncbi:MAG TPA: SIS domain-containing protein [Chloroflexus aurantiacus]|jgi:D-sedoheptulose 7-phosphate isomerase|uniref:Sugar isomerase (SIS) n=1 Tax=Chloroflexus aurantiacus (strain ATCC 29366 / DSM 635 / J-10-fl) TaxID=324602 RepID=A9WC14_CHLAA|nr:MULTISPECIES: SIS domain-containing protein [Chloroflexus]ABY36966.1 sugar isomerase (SIS) [Chloroflexus aurantiacus J-10-fl]RMG47708.1 MAG: SIS domain-containing protein [Chloroflexota bacterium]GIV93268.1 MAG: phosphoheptose isomerase [Chloroflexus sp.]HBW67851.1 SIS domain-containing protein [Chloroflexus aurantiacus]